MDYKIILGVVGGLGLFIYGMYLLSESLRKLSLTLLKTMLEKMTSNKIRATLVGIIVTAIIQSSSAASVILIGFLNAGFITLAGALAIMLGAHVGTTITAQLIAFKLSTVAPIFVFIGVMVFFLSRKDKNKNKGLAILGFGFLFVGLAMMSAAVKPLADNEVTRNFFLNFGKEPFLGVLTGFLVTAILQSSSTVTGMIIACATVGLLDLPSSIYLIFGTNIGTGVTAILASIGGNLASKKLALGNILFTVTATAIALPCTSLYLTYIPMISADVARQIANAHTAFNVVSTMILLPFVRFVVAFLDKVIPGQDYEKKEAKHLDKNLLVTPNLAIKAVVKEMVVMLSICKEMLGKARICTISYNHKIKNEISLDEESVDEMQKNITSYLVEVTQTELSDKQRRLVPALLHSVNDIEKVADYCEHIVILSQRAFEHDLTYSSHAVQELEKLFDKTETLMRHTQKAILNDDHKAAGITLNIEQEIDELTAQYKMNHVKRLAEGICFSDAGLVYTDVLTDIERLNDHLCNITKGVLHIGKR
ncbi:MAG TPA: Na/Pi cotransporter family protein [Deltaproteobacteria bacterium]|nr:Na/Pi cotransporter family protein [Deltaproteobacteria bacterium]